MACFHFEKNGAIRYNDSNFIGVASRKTDNYFFVQAFVTAKY